MIDMCNQSLTAESAVRNLKNTRVVPSEKWFCNIMNTINRDRAEIICSMMIRRPVRLAKKRGMGKTRNALMAIDKHPIGQFDRNGMEHLLLRVEERHQQARGVRHDAGCGGADKRGTGLR